MDWRGFELHPEVPAGGMPTSRLFPPEMLGQFEQHLNLVADRFGVGRPLRLGDHLPSSRAALAMTEHAREQGRLNPFREAVMDAYWLDGLDLESPDELGGVAGEVGLDAAAARASMDDPAYLGRVDALRDEAAGLAVTGIPTFFFGEARIIGCEPYEVLAQATVAAGAARR